MTLVEFYAALPETSSPKTEFVKRVAAACNVDPTTVRNWVKGRSKPENPEHVNIICAVTHLPKAELFNL